MKLAPPLVLIAVLFAGCATDAGGEEDSENEPPAQTISFEIPPLENFSAAAGAFWVSVEAFQPADVMLVGTFRVASPILPGSAASSGCIGSIWEDARAPLDDSMNSIVDCCFGPDAWSVEYAATGSYEARAAVTAIPEWAVGPILLNRPVQNGSPSGELTHGNQSPSRGTLEGAPTPAPTVR